MSETNALHVNGIVPIVPTPFTIEEQIDWPSLRRLVDFACATGACAMCLPAYASEYYKLSESERLQLVAEAVRQAAGRLPVFAQVNFVSLPQAVETAREVERMGASAIAAAVPRMFAFEEPDLWRYFDRLNAHPHFRWIKLEEPMMSSKVVAILEATGGEVGVLEGWGGMYMLDLIPAGICGVMPGLAISDVLAKVFQLATHNDLVGAYQVHEGALPQISFSLQHIELFHHAEKRLLVARGILPSAAVRPLTLQLDRHTEERIAFLNGRILALLDQLDLPRHPSLLPSHEGVWEV
jgi:4-hydroxy-tetrahydrodipicolinate synthase